MFDQMSGYPVAESSWHIKLTIMGGQIECKITAFVLHISSLRCLQSTSMENLSNMVDIWLKRSEERSELETFIWEYSRGDWFSYLMPIFPSVLQIWFLLALLVEVGPNYKNNISQLPLNIGWSHDIALVNKMHVAFCMKYFICTLWKTKRVVVWWFSYPDCSLPDTSVHGISQARILEWIAISFSRGTLRPKDQTQCPVLQAVFCIAGGCFTDWATRESYLEGWRWPFVICLFFPSFLFLKIRWQVHVEEVWTKW